MFATGLTGGLNWYRAASQYQDNDTVTNWDIDVPCLHIGAENDLIFPPSSADHIGNFVKDTERHTVTDCGVIPPSSVVTPQQAGM